uniref:PKS_ER domain-containing protein n=1 Tax=Syphacia muris TaxID=451379 RepID=A0A0N5AMF7_9BILA
MNILKSFRFLSVKNTLHQLRHYRAAVVKNFGDPLEIVDCKDCVAEDDQIVVNVECAGFNYADIQTVDGKYHLVPETPFIPGFELAGSVRSVGKNVKKFKEGDRVMALKTGSGAFAEQCVLRKSDLVFPIPYSVEYETAASFAVCYGTAYIGLRSLANERQGNSILVLSRRGTIGFSTIDLAQNVFKAQVLAASDNEDKLDKLRSAGVLSTFNYTDKNFVDDVRKTMFGKGVDLVVDAVGGDTFYSALKTLRVGGRIVSVGFSSGIVPSVNLLELHRVQATVSGVWLGTSSQDELEDVMKSLLELLNEGYLSVRTAKKYPLNSINDCIKDIKEDKVYGKTLIVMG